MHQIYVNPVFGYPNNWSGTNTCHLTIAVNATETRVLVIAAQRHGEAVQGTSVINQIEAIAQQVMLHLLPELSKQHPALRRAEVLWVTEVITGDPMYNTRSLVDVQWQATRAWPRRMFQKHDFSRRPQVDFFNGLLPSDYLGLLEHGRSHVTERTLKTG